MRIEERFAVQVMPSLRDEVNFVENDLGGMPEVVEARARGDDQQRRYDDRVGGNPRRRYYLLFNVILDLPGHREFLEERTDRRDRSASVLQSRDSVVNRGP